VLEDDGKPDPRFAATAEQLKAKGIEDFQLHYADQPRQGPLPRRRRAAALLAGAFGSEYWGGLYPCEMCWWQRYAHFAPSSSPSSPSRCAPSPTAAGASSGSPPSRS
jgi:hypothetical protein